MTFREQLRRRLCAIYWSFRNGHLDGKFSIPATGLRPKHLAVVLPPEFHDFDVAHHFLEPLIEHTNPQAATVIVRENFRTWLSRDLPIKLVTFDLDEHDWLGFPKGNIYKKVKELEADVVVDLTPAFTPFTAALAASTAAPLRVSLDSVHEHCFYNFFLNFGPDKTLAERYDLLLRYV
ncbi:hypothetical protein EHM69_08170 [candidate division KSB1 bacterium]|nr:MAG: hypothetical protein EHM69_08170 [candidate division KSB1 bacterium]